MFKLVVLSCAVALVAASPIAPWGLGLASPLVAPGVAPLGLAGGIWGAPAIAAYNYRGPVSLAPGQPASILAADGRPLDTLSVNLDRAAHLTARAVNAGVHLLKKRSVLGAPVIAPGHVGALGWPAAVGALGLHGAAPLVGPAGVAPLGVNPIGTNPIGINPIGSYPKGIYPLGINPIGTNPLGGIPLGVNPIGVSPLGVKSLGHAALGRLW